MERGEMAQIADGHYVVKDGSRSVLVSRLEHLRGPKWIAAAEWGDRRCLGPVWTQQGAAELAKKILAEG